MIDTELRLLGSEAAAFRNMMTSVDLNSIILRDNFVRNVKTEVDEEGTLTIDCPDIQFDLSAMKEVSNVIESIMIEKVESYIVDKKSENYLSDYMSIICGEEYEDVKYMSSEDRKKDNLNAVGQEEAMCDAA